MRSFRCMDKVSATWSRGMLTAPMFVLLATGCAAHVSVADEPPTFNDPDAPIVCPGGSERRVAATRYRDLLADPSSAWKEIPAGYSPPAMLQVPTVRYPSAILNPRPGFASVFASVDREGGASSFTIICSSERAFESAAIEAMATARFGAGTINGEPLEEDFVIVPFRFQLP